MGFYIDFEVPFADVDQHGVLHHPKYLNYLEQARIKLLQAVGLDYRTWVAEGFMLPVVDIQIRYSTPLMLGDWFRVSIPTVVVKGRRSIILSYEMHKLTHLQSQSGASPQADFLLACRATVQLMSVSTSDNRVIPLPDKWLQPLAGYAQRIE